MANGSLEGLTDLLNNRLLLQYLSAAGQDLLSGQPIGSNVNAATQQNIQARSYVDLLRNMLSSGGKMSMDKDNITIKAPTQSLQGPGGVPAGSTGATNPGALNQQSSGSFPSVGGSVRKPAQSVDILTDLLMGGGSPNPTSSPLDNIDYADLAGLTTQDISQALQFKFADKSFKHRKMEDLYNNIYRMHLIQQSQRAANQQDRVQALNELKELRMWEEQLRRSPLEVPGMGRISFESWEKMPTNVKAYSYYAFNAKQAGEKVMSFNDFQQQADPGTLVEYYKLAMEDPEFYKFYFKSKEAGATQINVGESMTKKRASEFVELESKLADKVRKTLDSNRVRVKIMNAPAEERPHARAKVIANLIDSELANRGKIINREITEDGIGIWTIRTKANTLETIRYDLYE